MINADILLQKSMLRYAISSIIIRYQACSEQVCEFQADTDTIPV
jgi:hypothetical protein